MAAKDKIDEFITGQILSQPLEDIVGERFGRYSKYIIQDRALFDRAAGTGVVGQMYQHCIVDR